MAQVRIQGPASRLWASNDGRGGGVSSTPPSWSQRWNRAPPPNWRSPRAPQRPQHSTESSAGGRGAAPAPVSNSSRTASAWAHTTSTRPTSPTLAAANGRRGWNACDLAQESGVSGLARARADRGGRAEPARSLRLLVLAGRGLDLFPGFGPPLPVLGARSLRSLRTRSVTCS